jgi:hypothetical protein
MKNEYLILYAIADMLAYHFISNGLAKIENGELIFTSDPKKYSKPERRIYEVMMKIIFLLNKKLSREGFLAIKNKYEKLLEGFKDSKYFKEYAPILVGITILNDYARAQGKKSFYIHPGSVEKILELTKAEAKFNYLDKFSLNSMTLGSKFFKEMTR